MNINCPKCGMEYEIDDSKIPETGAKVKCSQCGTMIDIELPKEELPDWYITTDGENIYEATNEEVIEWISENRLLRKHKISKNSQNWSRLDEIPKFLEIFKNKEMEDSVLEESTKEQIRTEPIAVQTYKKIDYTDYDDSIIDSSDTYKAKKNHFFIWFIMFLIMGVGIFAVIKPKLIKRIFTKINSKNNAKSEDNYNRAMLLLKNYDIADKKNILLLFNKSLKENPNYKAALIGKATYLTNLLYLEKLNLNFRTKLAKKLNIISKKINNGIINNILIKNNKDLLNSKNNIKFMEALLTDKYKNKLKSSEFEKNHEVILILGLMSYFNGNKNALKKYLSDSTTISTTDYKTAFLRLLFLKMNNDKSYLVVLDELTTKYANSIPLNFLNAFELLEQNKYVDARYIFKAIKGFSTKNKIATDYIFLLNDLIKNKKLLVKDKIEDKNEENKEENKEDKKEKDVVKNDSKKNKTKKIEVKKVVKKLSASRASEIGWDLIDSNRLSAAIKKFKYAISINPNQADAYQGLGVAYRMRKDKNNAIKYLKIFLVKAPNDSEAPLVRKQIKKLESDK